jgi:hypothetical protein
MGQRLLPQIDDRLRQYESEHHGEKPLYMIMPKGEAQQFIEEVRERDGLDEKIVITEYRGTKVVNHEALKPGEIRLSNDLPDTGS